MKEEKHEYEDIVQERQIWQLNEHLRRSGHERAYLFCVIIILLIAHIIR